MPPDAQPHPAMHAALESYRLSNALYGDAGVLWQADRVATALGLAVMSLEADSKASQFLAEVTRIGTRGTGAPHQRRIAQALASLRLIFGSGLQDIAGSTNIESLGVDEIWELRQRAFYVDLNDGRVSGPEDIDPDVAASVLALAGNVVAVRALLLQLDADLLALFFMDYGAAYRQYLGPVEHQIDSPAWFAATAQFFAHLDNAWVFDWEPPYGLKTLSRREGAEAR